MLEDHVVYVVDCSTGMAVFVEWAMTCTWMENILLLVCCIHFIYLLFHLCKNEDVIGGGRGMCCIKQAEKRVLIVSVKGLLLLLPSLLPLGG